MHTCYLKLQSFDNLMHNWPAAGCWHPEWPPRCLRQSLPLMTGQLRGLLLQPNTGDKFRTLPCAEQCEWHTDNRHWSSVHIQCNGTPLTPDLVDMAPQSSHQAWHTGKRNVSQPTNCFEAFACTPMRLCTLARRCHGLIPARLQSAHMPTASHFHFERRNQ